MQILIRVVILKRNFSINCLNEFSPSTHSLDVSSSEEGGDILVRN